MSLVNNGITRIPPGINAEVLGSIFNNIRKPNPLQYHEYYQDFDTYAAADWTVTETQAGATQALTAGDGGLILLTNSAADDDVNQIQKLPVNFLMEATKELYFAARFAISDVVESDAFIGLQVANTDGSGAVTDGLYFLKADGDASLLVRLRKNTTTGATQADTTIDLVNATQIVVAAYYDGIDRLYYAVNGAVLGYLDASAAFLPDTALAPIAGVKNGEAVAKTMTVDYIYVAKARYSL